MIRLSFFVLCMLLFAAAAGRYKAEVAVREMREEIQRLDRRASAEAREIRLLRAEAAYLESPTRLAEIASIATDLRPLASDQLLTAQDFLAAYAPRDRAPADATPADRSAPVEPAPAAIAELAPGAALDVGGRVE